MFTIFILGIQFMIFEFRLGNLCSFVVHGNYYEWTKWKKWKYSKKIHFGQFHLCIFLKNKLGKSYYWLHANIKLLSLNNSKKTYTYSYFMWKISVYISDFSGDLKKKNNVCLCGKNECVCVVVCVYIKWLWLINVVDDTEQCQTTKRYIHTHVLSPINERATTTTKNWTTLWKCRMCGEFLGEKKIIECQT